MRILKSTGSPMHVVAEMSLVIERIKKDKSTINKSELLYHVHKVY